jgi:hypothetical protein
MHTAYIQIAKHLIFVSSREEETMAWIREQFRPADPGEVAARLPDIILRVSSGYGKPAETFNVQVRRDDNRLTYRRDDFLLETDDRYTRASMAVHDDTALNHALMTLYSAHIVHNGWGLMIHASCIVQGGTGHLFAGQSGAGKSTVAMLSRPRPVLSDEAAIVCLEGDRPLTFDSPFRSDSVPTFDPEPIPVGSLHLLTQSLFIDRRPIRPSELVYRIMDKIFYWAADPAETVKLIALCGKLAEHVPAYDLYFQKNDLFWERIS